MKKTLIIFLCLFLMACSSPEASFEDNQGHTLQFSQLKGKWIVLNYWATWCGSCVKEIPNLNAFSKKYAKKVMVLGVSYDDLTPEQINQQVTQLNIQYALLLDKPNDYLKLKAITVVPTTIIINPNGKVVDRLLGPQTVASLKEATHQ